MFDTIPATSQSMVKLEPLEVESFAQHIFDDNITAQELHKKAGFEIVGMNLKKP